MSANGIRDLVYGLDVKSTVHLYAQIYAYVYSHTISHFRRTRFVVSVDAFLILRAESSHRNENEIVDGET